MSGRPILGAVSGLVFGAVLALDLQQFSVRPLDTLSLIGLPVAGLVIGLLLGIWSPLKFMRSSRREQPVAYMAGAAGAGAGGAGHGAFTGGGTLTTQPMTEPTASADVSDELGGGGGPV